MDELEEITAEFALTDLVQAPPLLARAHVTIAAKTDLGRVRENNEDKFEFYVPTDVATLASKGQIFVVCDGMGGHAAGQFASELAAKTFIDVYLSHPSPDAKEAMSSAISAANRYVYEIATVVPNRRGMGTTFTGMILLQDRVYVIQVGDSRAYRLRGEELTQLMEDHTYMNEMVKIGALTVEQALNHPQKHVITRAIGVDASVSHDLFEYEMHEGDTYFLCSDGVLNHLDDETIRGLLIANDPAAATWKIVGQTLVGGGSDNTTALVVKINAIERLEPTC
jgi:protein phosphatase